jgi:hypothetical protein
MRKAATITRTTITASKRWSLVGVGSERFEAVGVADEDEVELETTGDGDIRFLTVELP